MADTPLDLGNFANAIGQLREAVELTEEAFATGDPRVARVLRTAVVQAFEFTFELSIKTIRRYLEIAEANGGEVKHYSFNRLLRLAYQREITRAELATWLNFRDLRNMTSDTYDEQKAEEVYESSPDLLAVCEDLLAVLRVLVVHLS